jgi:tRNA (guanine-N7-)-methyltransferase
MRNNLTVSSAAASVEFVPENYLIPLDFDLVFGRSAPVEIDLGCGDGAFVTALARQNPEHNFLGIERLVGRVRSTCRKAARENLSNLRVLRVEIAYAARYLVPAESVAMFYLLFPDPWPKTRHHRRRIVTAEFLESIRNALMPGGILQIATDEADYFEQITRLCAVVPGFSAADPGLDVAHPVSTFGERFREAGVKTYLLELRKMFAL